MNATETLLTNTAAAVGGQPLLQPVSATLAAVPDRAPVSLESLGRDIVARIKAGEAAAARSEAMYVSAGLQLIEAKRRVPNFTAFLRKHCKGLSRSRAYELIDIAEGKADE